MHQSPSSVLLSQSLNLILFFLHDVLVCAENNIAYLVLFRHVLSMRRAILTDLTAFPSQGFLVVSGKVLADRAR